MSAPMQVSSPPAAVPGRGAQPRIGRLDAVGYLICLGGIVRRELLRFFNQKERFFSALVRPLVWLFIFAAGFRNTLGVSIEPPYQTYVLYEVYVVPGLAVAAASRWPASWRDATEAPASPSRICCRSPRFKVGRV